MKATEYIFQANVKGRYNKEHSFSSKKDLFSYVRKYFERKGINLHELIKISNNCIYDREKDIAIELYYWYQGNDNFLHYERINLFTENF